jgi:hypothetical protein
MIKLDSVQQFEHIRYSFIDGVCYRVCNPFRDAITFLIPITTPEDEYEKDRAIIDSGIEVMMPSMSSEDPNADRDHFSEVMFEDKTGFPEPNVRITSVIGNDKTKDSFA